MTIQSKLLHFRDLKSRGIVANQTTLRRWIRKIHFPPGFMMGVNTRVWTEEEIEAWLAERRLVTPETSANAKQRRAERGLAVGG